MDPIARLISHFTKFPGVGNKSARRMVFYLLKQDAAQLRELGAGIASLKDDLHTCSECGNISDGDPCPICRDALRDRRTLCVVENIDDLVSFEQAGIYNGLYHVLGGRVSPFDDEDLSPESVEFLLRHIRDLRAEEVIIATNPVWRATSPTMPFWTSCGDSTARRKSRVRSSGSRALPSGSRSEAL